MIHMEHRKNNTNTGGFPDPGSRTSQREVVKDKSFLSLRKNCVSYSKNLPCSRLNYNRQDTGITKKKEKSP